MAKFCLEYGLLSPPLSEQLDGFNIIYDKTIIEFFQLDEDALNRLRIRRLIPPSQIDKAFDKLTQRVVEHVTENMKARDP